MNGFGRLGLDMARKMTLKNNDDLLLILNNLSNVATIEKIAKRALFEGMKPMADKAKSNLASVIDAGNGDLIDSLGISPIKKNDKGGYDVALGISGYDRNGVANLLKARVKESGSSKQNKTPWMRPAINATRSTSLQKMQEVVDTELKKIGGK